MDICHVLCFRIVRMFSHRCFNFSVVSAVSSSHWLNNISSRVPMRWWVCVAVDDNHKSQIKKVSNFFLEYWFLFNWVYKLDTNIHFHSLNNSLVHFQRDAIWFRHWAHQNFINHLTNSDSDSHLSCSFNCVRSRFTLIFMNGYFVCIIFFLDAISDYSRSNCDHIIFVCVSWYSLSV